MTQVKIVKCKPVKEKNISFTQRTIIDESGDGSKSFFIYAEQKGTSHFNKRLKSVTQAFVNQNKELKSLLGKSKRYHAFIAETLRINIVEIMFGFKYSKKEGEKPWSLAEAANDSIEMILYRLYESYGLCKNGELKRSDILKVERITDAFIEMIPR